MSDDDFFENEDLSEEKKLENTIFNLLSDDKSLKNIFILSEILNDKKFESE